jgi:hypothetical protein
MGVLFTDATTGAATWVSACLVQAVSNNTARTRNFIQELHFVGR